MAWALKAAGEIYRKGGDSAKARKHLQRAWELDPMDKGIRQALQMVAPDAAKGTQ